MVYGSPESFPVPAEGKVDGERHPRYWQPMLKRLSSFVFIACAFVALAACDERPIPNQKASSGIIDMPVTNRNAASGVLDKPITNRNAASGVLDKPVTNRNAAGPGINLPLP